LNPNSFYNGLFLFAESRERAEDPAVLTPGAEASLRQLIAFCPGDFKEFLIFKLRQFLETSYSYVFSSSMHPFHVHRHISDILFFDCFAG
jgi:hypothetical protein